MGFWTEALGVLQGLHSLSKGNQAQGQPSGVQTTPSPAPIQMPSAQPPTMQTSPINFGGGAQPTPGQGAGPNLSQILGATPQASSPGALPRGGLGPSGAGPTGTPGGPSMAPPPPGGMPPSGGGPPTPLSQILGPGGGIGVPGGGTTPPTFGANAPSVGGGGGAFVPQGQGSGVSAVTGVAPPIQPIAGIQNAPGTNTQMRQPSIFPGLPGLVMDIKRQEANAKQSKVANMVGQWEAMLQSSDPKVQQNAREQMAEPKNKRMLEKAQKDYNSPEYLGVQQAYQQNQMEFMNKEQQKAQMAYLRAAGEMARLQRTEQITQANTPRMQTNPLTNKDEMLTDTQVRQYKGMQLRDDLQQQNAWKVAPIFQNGQLTGYNVFNKKMKLINTMSPDEFNSWQNAPSTSTRGQWLNMQDGTFQYVETQTTRERGGAPPAGAAPGQAAPAGAAPAQPGAAAPQQPPQGAPGQPPTGGAPAAGQAQPVSSGATDRAGAFQPGVKGYKPNDVFSGPNGQQFKVIATDQNGRIIQAEPVQPGANGAKAPAGQQQPGAGAPAARPSAAAPAAAPQLQTGSARDVNAGIGFWSPSPTPAAGAAGGRTITTNAPVVAYDPKTNVRRLSTAREAAQNGWVNQGKITVAQVEKAATTARQFNDVQSNLSRYVAAAKRFAFEGKGSDAIGINMAINEAKLGGGIKIGPLGDVELPGYSSVAEAADRVARSAAYKSLSPAGKDLVDGYLRTASAVPAYQKALTSVGRFNVETMRLELANIPDPTYPPADILRKLTAFQENVDQGSAGLINVGGVPTMQETRDKFEKMTIPNRLQNLLNTWKPGAFPGQAQPSGGGQ